MKIENLKLKIVFLGTSEFAIPTLKTLLLSDNQPILVITSEDKPAGRGRKLASSPVKALALANNLAILEPSKIDRDFIEKTKVLGPDIGVLAAYGKILPKAFIEAFPLGILNIHPSLLPKYRGPSPIQAAILNGDKKTGVTIILIDEKMDHGPILAERAINIDNPDYLELHNQLAELGIKVLLEVLPEWIQGNIKPRSQNESEATYSKLIKKEDGQIDWSRPAEEIERMVRAYNPWPGAYTKIKNGEILKIKKVKVENGVLKILIVQPESKKEMPWDAFLRGHPEFLK